MYALRDGTGNVTNNMDDIMKLADMLYVHLYTGSVRPANGMRRTSLVCKVPTATKDDVEKTLVKIKRGKAAGDDGRIANLLKDVGDVAVEKLTKLNVC